MGYVLLFINPMTRRDMPHCPFFTTVGTIEERARHLDRFLAKRLHGRDINLLAHSMGGLDARFLIAHLPNRAYTVRSLTTVATPHRGSPVMDWVRDTIGIGARPRDVLLASEVATAEGSATASKDKVAASLLTRLLSPFDAPAYSNLTTDYMTQRFNPATPDDPNVKYYSYGGAANVATLSPIRLTWEIVREKEGANDGIVSVYSARWGM